MIGSLSIIKDKNKIQKLLAVKALGKCSYGNFYGKWCKSLSRNNPALLCY